MKITKRILLRWTGGFSLLVALVWWCCLEGVDQRPYFTTPYYAQTRERWRSMATNQAVVSGELAAGFGRVSLVPGAAGDAVSPGPAIPLAGYGSRKGRPAVGVHDELQAKAVAFRVASQLAVMVSADALIIPREVAELAVAQLERELKLSRDQIYFGATHTHSGPGGWGEGFVAGQFAGGFVPAVRPWFARQLAAAVRLAVADLSPAGLGHQRVAAPGFLRNRLVGELGRVDPEFSFTVVKKKTGALAMLGSFSAHATVLPASVMEFSGDYPGYWQRAVERGTGGLALFFAGGVGSHRPEAGAAGFAGAERMGAGLAQAVLEALPRVQFTDRVALGVAGLEVALPGLHVRLTDGLRLRPWLAAHLLPVGGQSFLQVFRLGPVCWVSTPCDFSGELALEFKEHCRALGGDAVVTSFNGDYLGYVIPHRYYHLAGYEPRLMSFFGPATPDYFLELIRLMQDRLHAAP